MVVLRLCPRDMAIIPNSSGISTSTKHDNLHNERERVIIIHTWVRYSYANHFSSSKSYCKTHSSAATTHFTAKTRI